MRPHPVLGGASFWSSCSCACWSWISSGVGASLMVPAVWGVAGWVAVEFADAFVL
jgi:hypothetical protein